MTSKTGDTTAHILNGFETTSLLQAMDDSRPNKDNAIGLEQVPFFPTP